MKYSTKSYTILAYTVYLPTAGLDEQFQEILSQLANDLLVNLDQHCTLLIGLDSNQSLKSSRRRTEAMSRFRAQFSLKSILVNDEPTFHHNNEKSVSQIDHILFYAPQMSSVDVNLQKHICKLFEPENLSSHDAIVGKIQLPTDVEDANEVDFSSSYSSFNVAKPNWTQEGMESYQSESAEMLEYLSAKFNSEEEIPMLTEVFSKALLISAERNFEVSKPKKGKIVKQPYFSTELKLAHSEHKKVCQKWREAGRPSNSDHPAKAAKLESQRKLQSISRQDEVAKAHKNHNELMTTYSQNIGQVCRKLKQIRGENVKALELPFIETMNGVYTGKNVLEGFCSNTESLCKDNSSMEHEFYRMCVEDNLIIFEITSQENAQTIPHMSLPNLKEILFRRLKLNKACDVYKLTVEHLRYSGDAALQQILSLLNSIIDHINFLSATQLNTAIASVIHKGKNKSLYNHKSYRQVRVTPLIGRCLDEYLRPNLSQILKPLQNTSQYGFTENVTYMMGALQRHEVEKYCIDSKRTFFGCSLDGDSAFEVVNREILTRELYCAGEKGQYWLASHFSYQNTETRIKMNGQLSRSFEETLGVKQGHIKSSENYKVYVNSLLETIDSAQLGVWIGSVNVGLSAVADDEYLMSDSQSRLQALLGIAEKYGFMYKVAYGAAKTKVTVVGSQIDMQYYSEVTPWTLNEQKVRVCEDNDHLGQIVSGINQEEKNVDNRISKARSNLFGMLGSAFSFKCLLSPKLKFHLFRTYTCPILRSGLSSFSLKTEKLRSITLFHRKTLRGILNFSNKSNIAALHFLLGELPMEAKIHRDVFSLFFSVWSNPESKIYSIVKYLLENNKENSRTWSSHLRYLSSKYGLMDPLLCMQKDPPSKSLYKEGVMTKICAYHEKDLREKASSNSRMTYLNVSLSSLRGRPHPSLDGILTSHEVKKARIHLKMLAGDYFTHEIKASQSGGSPNCRSCAPTAAIETIEHIISVCEAYTQIRDRILMEFKVLCSKSKTQVSFTSFMEDQKMLTQFILDPSSFNIADRVHLSDPVLPDLFKKSRDFCYAIHAERSRLLQQL